MKTNIITIDADEIVVRLSEEHEFLLDSKEVARGYGVGEEVIRQHKRRHADELIEGKHWVVRNTDTLGSTGVTNSNARHSGLKRGNDTVTLWTKSGVIRLGFFIRSQRAKKFRDAAEDLVLRETTQVTRAEFSGLQATVVSLADSLAMLATTLSQQANLLGPVAVACMRIDERVHRLESLSPLHVTRGGDHLDVELERAMLAALGDSSRVVVEAKDLLEVARKQGLLIERLSNGLPQGSLGRHLAKRAGRRIGSVTLEVRGENRHRRYIITRTA